jgi:hypothetical protein
MLRATLIGELPVLFLAYGSAPASLKRIITSPCPREVIVARHNSTGRQEFSAQRRIRVVRGVVQRRSGRVHRHRGVPFSWAAF